MLAFFLGDVCCLFYDYETRTSVIGDRAKEIKLHRERASVFVRLFNDYENSVLGVDFYKRRAISLLRPLGNLKYAPKTVLLDKIRHRRNVVKKWQTYFGNDFHSPKKRTIFHGASCGDILFIKHFALFCLISEAEVRNKSPSSVKNKVTGEEVPETKQQIKPIRHYQQRPQGESADIAIS